VVVIGDSLPQRADRNGSAPMVPQIIAARQRNARA